jgi:hypothetical protein
MGALIMMASSSEKMFDKILVTPTALALSLLHAGGRKRPMTMARTPLDFMRRALTESPAVAVVARGWLSEVDLRRLALRRIFSSSPRLVLVLPRGESPTVFEWKYFDAVVVAGEDFFDTAFKLQRLVNPPPPRLAA